MSKSPTVSIVTITYNHEKYIAQALDSFLAQKSDFNFEIVIADDCSTDRTAEIIEKYAAANPGVIKPILRKKNIGAAANSINSLRSATGKYIALCEGDDYFVDPYKLQKQVDFLEANTDYALCFHPVKISYNETETTEIYPQDKTGFTAKNLLKHNFIQTCSVMYRRKSYEAIPEDIMPLDWYLHLYHATFGKIGFIDEPMSVYRRHKGGIWWDSDRNLDKIWEKYGLAHLALYVEMLKLHGNSTQEEEIIYGHIQNLLSALRKVDDKKSGHLLRQAIKMYPSITYKSIERLLASVKELSETVQAQGDKILDLEATNEELSTLVKQQADELGFIKATRLWRARTTYMRGKSGLRHPRRSAKKIITKIRHQPS